MTEEAVSGFEAVVSSVQLWTEAGERTFIWLCCRAAELELAERSRSSRLRASTQKQREMKVSVSYLMK